MQSCSIADGFVFVKRHWWEFVGQRGDFLMDGMKNSKENWVKLWLADFRLQATKFIAFQWYKNCIVHARQFCMYKTKAQNKQKKDKTCSKSNVQLRLESKKNCDKKVFSMWKIVQLECLHFIYFTHHLEKFKDRKLVFVTQSTKLFEFGGARYFAIAAAAIIIQTKKLLAVSLPLEYTNFCIM